MAKGFASYSDILTLSDEIVVRRRDTRLFFGDQEQDITRKFGHCVGAFYLQNPGSAAGVSRPHVDANGLKRIPWGPLNYASEALLPTLEAVLRETLCLVERNNSSFAEQLRETGYVQILNLSYIRNPADSKQPLKEWRELVQARKVQEDCPPGKLKFIVFGWGGAYHSAEDSKRIGRILKKCTEESTRLIFPEAVDVRAGKPIHVWTAGAGCLERQLSRRTNYPCGGQHERTTYPPLYCQAVAPILASSMLD